MSNVDKAKHIFKKVFNIKDPYTIPKGELGYPVYGFVYCKPVLWDSDDILVSLAPKNAYQRQQDWPEGEIVNIVTAGSKETNEKNFIGYVWHEDADMLRAICNTYSPVYATMSLMTHPKTGEREAFLMIPESFIPKAHANRCRKRKESWIARCTDI